MNDRIRDIAIGVAAIAAIIATATLLLSFGAFRGAMQSNYPATVRLDRAGGLRYGSQITLDGVPIGLIQDVALEMTQPQPVKISCAIDEWARIPVNNEVVVETALIGGGTILAFRSTGEATERLIYEPEELPIFIGNYSDVRDTISALLDSRMGPILDSFDSFGQLAITYKEVGERVNSLLAEGPESEESIRTAVVRINGVLLDARNALQLASNWLEDPQMQEDARTAIFKANLLIERATETIGKAGELADVLKDESSAVGSSLVATADAIDLTLLDLRSMLRKAVNGPGTVSRLLGDPALYEDMQDSVQRLESTLAAIQSLIDAIEKEGLTVEF